MLSSTLPVIPAPVGNIEPMAISVVTVVRNAVDTIEDTLQSVRSQDCSGVEHIVVDGASTDGTRAVLERYRSDVTKLVSEPDAGIYAAMNKGLRLAAGEVIGFLNADDLYAHARVLGKIKQVMADPGLDACYADLVYVARHDTTRTIRYWTSQSFRPRLFQRGWMPAHPTFFVRRRVYERYGGFDEKYKIQSDFELALRFLEIHRIQSLYIPEVLVRMRMGGVTNRSLGTILKGNIESYRACRAHGLTITPWFFLRKWAMRVPQFVRRPH